MVTTYRPARRVSVQDAWVSFGKQGRVNSRKRRSNKVIGVHINAIKGKDQLKKIAGPNPFANLGLEVSADGTRGRPTEWTDGKWIYYADLDTFEISRQPEVNRGKHLPLSHWLSVYDWVSGEGWVSLNKRHKSPIGF